MTDSHASRLLDAQRTTCHETDLGSAGILKSRLWRLAEERCIPLSATFEITLRCNLRCTHCYNFDRAQPYPREINGPELTVAEIRSVVDQLAAAGCLYLSFSGGEALLHPHLDELVLHAQSQRMAVRVKSNGTLLTPERVERLVKAGASSVDISLYGATSETHDAFTERAGSFDKTMLGIGNARRAGLDVKINISLVQSNASECAQMIAMVEEMGLAYSISPFITARYDGTTSSLDQRVDRSTLEELYQGPMRHLLRQPDFDSQKSVQCACARAICGISASGEVYPCIGAPIPSGNLRQQSFAEIWHNSPQFSRIRNLRLDDFTTCKTCPDRSYCGRSSGVVYTNTGDYTGPEEFTCMEAAVVRTVHQSQS